MPEVILTQDGITLTISNFVSSTNLSKADSDGLCFAGNTADTVSFCQDTTSLQLQFSKPVKLISFVTGYDSYDDSLPPSLTFSQGVFSSLQNSFSENISTVFSDQFVASSGIPILVTNNVSNPTLSKDSLQFRSLTVEDVPGPLPLMGAACALGYSRKLRRRISTTRPNP